MRKFFGCAISLILLAALALPVSVIAQEQGQAPDGSKVWEENTTRAHTRLQIPELPDDPAQVETVLRHMRGIANMPGEQVRALENMLLQGFHDEGGEKK